MQVMMTNKIHIFRTTKFSQHDNIQHLSAAHLADEIPMPSIGADFMLTLYQYQACGWDYI
jgi:hypothetical protein